MSNIRGFTLLEALIVIAITSILVSAAMPSFQASIERYQVRSQSDRFVSIIRLARVTAIENLQKVRICPSINQTSCDTSGGFNWGNGFIVLLDAADDGSFSQVSQVTGSFAAANTITLKDNADVTISSLTFRSLGVLDGVTSATFEFRMPNCVGLTNRDINIGFNGNASVSILDC